jgi:hypothetical protein
VSDAAAALEVMGRGTIEAVRTSLSEILSVDSLFRNARQ